MKVLSAIDFSPASELALEAAAALARATGGSVLALHAADVPGQPGDPEREPELARRTRLAHALAKRVSERTAQAIDVEVGEGAPDEVVLGRAQAAHADLIVLGPTGARHAAPWRLGSVAARIVKAAHVPVLIARDPSSLAAWQRTRGELRALVGVDGTPPSLAALAWLEKLRTAGKLDVTAAYVFPPNAERSASDVQVEGAGTTPESGAGGELRRWIAASGVRSSLRLRVVPSWGRAEHHLLELADATDAQLLVVGSQRRTLLERWRSGAVSLELAAHARINVLVVPGAPRASATSDTPRALRRVLAPCDLSAESARAIGWAAELLAPGGELVLVHVTVPAVPLAPDFGGFPALAPPDDEELARDARAVERRLRELLPSSVASRGIQVRFDRRVAFDTVTAIVNAANELAPDAICMTTHGRSGLSRAVMGSIAEGVLRRVHVPVLAVPPLAH